MDSNEAPRTKSVVVEVVREWSIDIDVPAMTTNCGATRRKGRRSHEGSISEIQRGLRDCRKICK